MMEFPWTWKYSTTTRSIWSKQNVSRIHKTKVKLTLHVIILHDSLITDRSKMTHSLIMLAISSDTDLACSVSAAPLSAFIESSTHVTLWNTELCQVIEEQHSGTQLAFKQCQLPSKFNKLAQCLKAKWTKLGSPFLQNWNQILWLRAPISTRLQLLSVSRQFLVFEKYWLAQKKNTFGAFTGLRACRIRIAWSMFSANYLASPKDWHTHAQFESKTYQDSKSIQAGLSHSPYRRQSCWLSRSLLVNLAAKRRLNFIVYQPYVGPMVSSPHWCSRHWCSPHWCPWDLAFSDLTHSGQWIGSSMVLPGRQWNRCVCVHAHQNTSDGDIAKVSCPSLPATCWVSPCKRKTQVRPSIHCHFTFFTEITAISSACSNFIVVLKKSRKTRWIIGTQGEMLQ